MDKRKERRTEEQRYTSASGAAVKRKRANPYFIVVIIVVIAVIALVILTGSLVSSHNKAKELEAQMTEQDAELARLQKRSADLEVHARGLAAENSSLSAQLEELLNVQEKEPVITEAQLKEQLNAISELVTQKYMYTNADNAAQSNTWLFGWDMPFSEKSFVVKYDGIIKAGIDLKDVTVDVDEENHKITVTLPESKITDNNVPQETVEVFGIKNGLFNEVTPDDSNELIVAGKQNMESKAIERGLLTEADKEAKAIIKAFLSLVPGVGTTYELEVR